MNNQIIGIDLSNSEDYTCISNKCGNCNTVIESKAFHPQNNKPQTTIFIKCPVCGIKFKKHIIVE